MFIWIYLRHYVNLVIIHAMTTDFVNVGPYELNWETQQYKCWISQYITSALLLCLQSINIFWLWFILKIAYNMGVKKVAQDVRSEDEDSEDEEEVRGDEKKVVGNGEVNGKVNGINGKVGMEGKKEK